MTRPTVLVTAAAGRTGSATVRRLRNLGFPVRAMVRRRDERSAGLARLGAEVIVGSLEDIVDLRLALNGVERAYFCPPLKPGALRKATLFATAAHEARLEVVVVLSQWLCDARHKALHASEKWLAQRVFEWVPDVGVVTVNPGFFADNYLAAFESIAQLGVMAMPLGHGLNAPPSTEDIARVIAGALVDPARHVGRTYRPTGPRLLSGSDIADTFARVLGRRVRFQDAPIALFLKAARSLGYGDYVISQLSWFLLDYQRNAFGIGAPTNAVLEVGGSAPEPFETIVRRHAEASPLTARTPWTQLRAMRRLVQSLLTPAPNLTAIAGRLELPVTEHGTLAMDSPDWRAAHGVTSRRSPPSPALR